MYIGMVYQTDQKQRYRSNAILCMYMYVYHTLAYYGESATPSQHTSPRMDSAFIPITGKTISEQNGLF